MLRVTFDGPDGVGKTTIIDKLALYLTRGLRPYAGRLMIFREPYDWFPAGAVSSWEDVESLKKDIRGNIFESADTLDVFTHYRAAMYEEIGDRLRRNALVLQDRSVLSTLAYNMRQSVPFSAWEKIAPDLGVLLLGPQKRPLDAPVDEIDADADKQESVRLSFVSRVLPSLLSGGRFVVTKSQTSAYEQAFAFITGTPEKLPRLRPLNATARSAFLRGTSACAVLPALYATGR